MRLPLLLWMECFYKIVKKHCHSRADGNDVLFQTRMEENRPKHHRRILSFVKREGRLTKGQARAMDELYPQFTIPLDRKINFEQVFANAHPVVMEIGFGNGHSLATMAANQPELNFVGLEVHRPGAGNLLLQIEKSGLENVRVLNEDAVEVLKNNIPDHSLYKVMIFFPDPWHKKRHHKRRLVQPGFVQLLGRKIQTGGVLHLATDWQDYAEHMLQVMEASAETTGLFKNEYGNNAYAPRPASRPETKFEQRGHRLGHGVWDLIYTRL